MRAPVADRVARLRARQGVEAIIGHLYLRPKSQPSAQFFVRNHDVLAIGRALLQPVVPLLDIGNLGDFGSHGEVAVQMHPARNVGERQTVAGDIGPRGQLGIENAQIALGRCAKARI